MYSRSPDSLIVLIYLLYRKSGILCIFPADAPSVSHIIPAHSCPPTTVQRCTRCKATSPPAVFLTNSIVLDCSSCLTFNSKFNCGSKSQVTIKCILHIRHVMKYIYFCIYIEKQLAGRGGGIHKEKKMQQLSFAKILLFFKCMPIPISYLTNCE